MITVALDFPDLSVIPTEEDWDHVANRIKNKILYLINASKNANGNALQDYTVQYKQWRSKQGLGGSVDWEVSGELISSIRYKVNLDGFEVYVDGRRNNEKLEHLHYHKNWQIFEWGSELRKSLNIALKQLIRDIGLDN